MNPITLLPPLFGLVVLLAVVVWAVTRKRELPEAIRSVMPGPPVEAGADALQGMTAEAKAKGRKMAYTAAVDKMAAVYCDEETARISAMFQAIGGAPLSPPPPPTIDPKVAAIFAPKP